MEQKNLLDKYLSLLFRYTEKLVLTAIGGLALMGIIQLMIEIYETQNVRLQDLLMMFIFIEIMAMTHVYFIRSTVPFTYPMFIAVTALSRLVVLQGKNIAPENLIYEGGAILLISLAILIIRYSQRFSTDAMKHEESAQKSPGESTH